MDLTDTLARLRSVPSDEAAQAALYDAFEALSRGPSVVADHREEAWQAAGLRFLQKVRDGLLPEMANPAAYIRRSVTNASIDLHRKRKREQALPVEPIAPPAEPDLDLEIVEMLDEAAETAARLRDNPQNGEILRRTWREMRAMAVDGVTLREAIVREEPAVTLDALERAVVAAHKRHQRARAAILERIDAKAGKSWSGGLAEQARAALNGFFRRRKATVRSGDAGTSGGHDGAR